MKHPLSLLEVVIGMALTAILLTTLFSSFRRIALSNQEIQKIYHATHWESVAYLRLTQIFETLEEEKGKYFLYTGPHPQSNQDALHLIFDNGIDPNPDFCGIIQGSLIWDKDNNLTLITENIRKEVFLKGVKEMELRFFDPKKRDWVDHWHNERLPPMVRLTVNEKSFYFTLPRARRLIEVS